MKRSTDSQTETNRWLIINILTRIDLITADAVFEIDDTTQHVFEEFDAGRAATYFRQLVPLDENDDNVVTHRTSIDTYPTGVNLTP